VTIQLLRSQGSFDGVARILKLKESTAIKGIPKDCDMSSPGSRYLPTMHMFGDTDNLAFGDEYHHQHRLTKQLINEPGLAVCRSAQS
jgi:hypothetical protein